MREMLLLCMIAMFTTRAGLAATSMAAVQKIYVAAMGQTDEAARFRMLLGDKLSKGGFTVVDSAEQADAVLSGVLAVRVYDDDSSARATMELKSKEGERIWSVDFGPHFGWGSSDPVTRRAEDVANALRKLRDKSRKE